jgi:uncharacterized protein YjbJ (UPF0337 family)
MAREHVKGAADKAEGAVKQGAGKLTGDKEMEREADKAMAGNVKDPARNAADSLKSKCGMDRACLSLAGNPSSPTGARNLSPISPGDCTAERSDRLPDHRAWDPAGALSGFNVRV